MPASLVVTSCLSSPPVGESFVTCYVSELTNPLLPLPPLQQVSPRLRCAAFPSSPALSSLSSPPASESSFAMCCISKLTSPFLPLPPFQLVSPHLSCATDPSSPTRSSLFLPSGRQVLIYNVPHFHTQVPSNRWPVY